MAPRHAKGLPTLALRDEDPEVSAMSRERAKPRTTRSLDIPIARIRPNPFQARRAFDDLHELVATIRTQGFTTRLRVRHDPSDPKYYQLVFGERRLRAAELAGLHEVPCDIAEDSDADLIEKGLSENLQRTDLSPLEEAAGIRDALARLNYSHRQLAEKIGKDKNYVEARLALLRMPEDVQQMVEQRPTSMRTAREVARLPTPEQRAPIIERVLEDQLAWPAARALVEEQLAQQAPEPTAPADDPPRAVETDSPPPTSITTKAAAIANGGRPLARESQVEQLLRKDKMAIQMIGARWRHFLPRLSPGEVHDLVAMLTQSITVLEQLRQAAAAHVAEE